MIMDEAKIEELGVACRPRTPPYCSRTSARASATRKFARALNLSINTVEKYVTQAKAQLRSMRCLRELSLKQRAAGV